jgi:membrane-bound serine protease (ClpP class)
MEFFLNPNTAYLVLMLGIVFAFLALITPGTGLLEVLAVLILIGAGYITSQIGLTLWALILLLVSVVPFFYGIRKPKRGIFLAVSLVGIVIGSAYLFPSNGWLPVVNPFLVIVTSTLISLFLWFTARKVLQTMQTEPLHDLEKVVGMTGIAKTSVHDSGSVQVGGELWSARSTKVVPSGRHIKVVRREGFTVIVEEEKKA